MTVELGWRGAAGDGGRMYERTGAGGMSGTASNGNGGDTYERIRRAPTSGAGSSSGGDDELFQLKVKQYVWFEGFEDGSYRTRTCGSDEAGAYADTMSNADDDGIAWAGFDDGANLEWFVISPSSVASSTTTTAHRIASHCTAYVPSNHVSNVFNAATSNPHHPNPYSLPPPQLPAKARNITIIARITLSLLLPNPEHKCILNPKPNSKAKWCRRRDIMLHSRP
ncbi:hypothetical protein M422DRAFT_251793 [Sphaerobolus stellatus SS14]|uniref:Uncharacterized protein n=1 Tax=Sphaerobolus stellatus (strain SS14) TaxID=990650 RepID=A0A0C9VR10_SPHS4|nr:hypothetical protein M422DRAFT_251793 [Sphaerobolus stellatus SS14]